VDEYTIQSIITLDVGRKMTGEDVIDRLAMLFVMHGIACIPSVNRPEIVSLAIQRGWPR
jgi:hypothetical protein